MKKIFLILCLFGFISVTSANELRKITMDIYLDKQGNAHINETWDMYTNEYTENYKPYYTLGESKITNFTVYDNTNTYEFNENWNVKGSFSDKAYKNGFNYIDNGVELCWGISKYGNNSYHLSYDVSNMVIKSSDGYGVFFWQLIPYDMDPTADLYDITIRTDDYLPDTIDVWGYGAYGKLAYVADGVIKLVGEDALSKDEYVIALVKFPKGMFETEYQDDRSFDEFLSMAEKGATNYKDKTNNILYRIFNFIIRMIPYLIFIVFGVFAAKNSGSSKYFKNLLFKEGEDKLPKDYPMFRDIPCKKNIYVGNYISYAYNVNRNDKNFIGCIILKWLKDDIISTDKDSKDPKLILNNPALPENYEATTHESNLYNWMYEASEDGILTTKAFKKYCKNHYSKILNWGGQSYTYGQSECTRLGYLTKSVEKPNKLDVSHEFYEEGKRVAGLKKFLNEFSDMKNKEPIEVHLWQEYLMFAQMFGIAEKVAKQFNKLYPEVYENSNYDYRTFVFVHNFTYTGYQAASAARSAAQSYSSGGGGFSSGGGGGGSFGGGGGGGGSR